MAEAKNQTFGGGPNSENERLSRRILEAGGVSELEERLYLLLLRNPGESLPHIADIAGLSRRRTAIILEEMQKRGLVSHIPGKQRKFFATPPDVAVETLIVQKEMALRRMRADAELLRQVLSQSDPTEEGRSIEVISGRAHQKKIFNQIQSAAREEIMGFARQPYVWVAMGEVNEAEMEALRRGVRVRGVYDHSSMEFANSLGRIRNYADKGEEARVVASVPIRMLIIDRRVALLPLQHNCPDDAALLVRESALLDALCELFEMFWERAIPLHLAKVDALALDDDEEASGDKMRSLVALLAAGFNDKSIAVQLGISERTLRRWLRIYMAKINAKTRFQAGWVLSDSADVKE